LRGGGYGEQAKVALEAILAVLAEAEWNDDDLKSLFGWTARLLQTKPPQAPVPKSHFTKPPPSQPPRPKPVGKPLGGLGAKGLDLLEKMKQQLEKKNKGDAS